VRAGGGQRLCEACVAQPAWNSSLEQCRLDADILGSSRRVARTHGQAGMSRQIRNQNGGRAKPRTECSSSVPLSFVTTAFSTGVCLAAGELAPDWILTTWKEVRLHR
jgi:hypothetical protein